MHMMSRHRNRRAPPLVGGQMRHCRVRHRQACTQRANPCISHAIPPGRPGPVHQLGANALSAQHVHAARCKLDPQHGVVIGCYGEDDVNAYGLFITDPRFHSVLSGSNGQAHNLKIGMVALDLPLTRRMSDLLLHFVFFHTEFHSLSQLSISGCGI